VFVARSSIGFLPMPLRFLTLPSRGACRVVETYMYLLNRLSATFTCRVFLLFQDPSLSYLVYNSFQG
jgi:hypothetical protein